MKKWMVLTALLLTVSMLCGCGKELSQVIEITVPAGSAELFVYSDEEISPQKGKITIHAWAGLSDTEVVLKPVEVKEENTYEPTYLTRGLPVTMDAEKDAWFKIGVSVQNPGEKDILVSVKVENVEVRIP